MEMLKKYWPLGFKVEKGNVVSLVVWLVIGLVACGLVSWLCLNVLGAIPVINIVCGILGFAFDVYGIINIVLCVLCFLGKV